MNCPDTVVLKLTGWNTEIVYEGPRKRDIRYSVADTRMAKRLLGFSPKYSPEEGLGRTLNAFSERDFS